MILHPNDPLPDEDGLTTFSVEETGVINDFDMDMTKKEMQKELDKQDIEWSRSLNKTELLELLKED